MRMIVLAGSELAWPRSHDRHRESGHPSSWVTRDRRKPGHRPLDHGQQLDHRYQEAKGTGSGGPLESANICSLWSDPMHYEVDVTVQHPLDANTERFLASVQRSANRVLRFRGDPVSYTHLDVYKRQPCSRYATRAIRRLGTRPDGSDCRIPRS